MSDAQIGALVAVVAYVAYEIHFLQAAGSWRLAVAGPRLADDAASGSPTDMFTAGLMLLAHKLAMLSEPLLPTG